MNLKIADIDASIFEKHMTLFAMEMAGVIGLRETIILVIKYGGRSISLTRKGKVVISEHIGEKAADKLAAHFHGCGYISIPMCAKVKMVALDLEIRREYERIIAKLMKSTTSAVFDVSVKFDVHERTVFRSLARTESEASELAKSRKEKRFFNNKRNRNNKGRYEKRVI